MNKPDNETAVELTGCFTSLIVIAIGPFISGYIIRQLWLWFVVPFGIIPISIAWAVGLDVLISCIAHQHHNYEPKKQSLSDVWAALVARIVIAPAITLWVGYIAHQYL